MKGERREERRERGGRGQPNSAVGRTGGKEQRVPRKRRTKWRGKGKRKESHRRTHTQRKRRTRSQEVYAKVQHAECQRRSCGSRFAFLGPSLLALRAV